MSLAQQQAMPFEFLAAQWQILLRDLIGTFQREDYGSGKEAVLLIHLPFELKQIVNYDSTILKVLTHCYGQIAFGTLSLCCENKELYLFIRCHPGLLSFCVDCVISVSLRRMKTQLNDSLQTSKCDHGPSQCLIWLWIFHGVSLGRGAQMRAANQSLQLTRCFQAHRLILLP